jgi:hypothetical protein
VKYRRLLTTFIVVLLFVFYAQENLTVYPRASAQTLPGAIPVQYLPFIVGGNPAPPPKTSSGSVFGIEVEDLSNPQILSDTQNANPTWIRQSGLNWDVIQPTKNGAYDWSSVAGAEATMIRASPLGYNLIQIVTSTPDWAQKYPGNPGPLCGPIKQSEFDSFGEFLKAAVERYSVPPYNVQYWEIGNEPDIPVSAQYLMGCWGDTNEPYYGGQYYGSMLTAVIPYIKQANPNVKIMNGGLLLACDPSLPKCDNPEASNFLEGMVKSGVVSQLDYVNFHAYDYQGANLGVFGNVSNWGTSYQNDPTLVAKVAFIRNVLNKYGLGGMNLIDTETAVLNFEVNCNALCMQNKALYIGRAYSAAIAEGLAANIWFQATNGWANSGLYNGPMYDAYVFARNELDAAHVTREITEYGSSANVAGYEFDRGDIKVWVLWSDDLTSHTINLPSTPQAVYTWTPNNGPYISVKPSPSLDIGIFPVYLEWSK